MTTIIAYDRNGNPKSIRQQPKALRVSMPGGRASIDAAGQFPTSTWLMQPPSGYEDNWRLMSLDSKHLERYSAIELMTMMADLSPEVSRALWDFLRLCNPGWEVKVTKPGGETEDAGAKMAVNAFTDLLSDRYGTFDIVIGRLFMGAFLGGAPCAELVLDERGKLPVDLATPDPTSVRFRRKSDPVLGQIWQPGQWQVSGWVALDRPTFRYVPIDPMPSSPYGRPLAAPALFTSVFLLGLLHDLKRVIQQQGYPRLDIAIDTARLIESAPSIMANAEAFQAFTAQIVAQVEDVYSQLQPDDAYIHTDIVQVNKPVGASGNGALSGIDAMITALERMAVRALKTMPLLMAISEAVGDVQSTRQWEIHIAGIKSLQHYVETLLGRLFKLALQAQGIQADVAFVFAEVRASEALRDAQTEQIQILNETAKRDQGWQTQDQASQNVTGSKAVAPAPAPMAPAQPGVDAPGIGNVEGQPTANNNAMFLTELREARAEVNQAMERIQVNGYH